MDYAYIIFSVLFILFICLGIFVSLLSRWLWKELAVKFPKIESQIPAFYRFRGNEGARLSYNLDIGRYITPKAFFKNKIYDYYSNLYRIDLIEKTKDKKIIQQTKDIFFYMRIRDVVVEIFIFAFLVYILSAIILSVL